MKKIVSILLSLLTLFSAMGLVGCNENGSKITSYDIAITYLDGTVDGVMTVDYYNDTENALNELKFNLHANAFREGAKYSPIGVQYTSQAYPEGVNYGNMEITSVKSGENALQFSVCGEDMNVLSVTLLDEIFPGERASVTVCYKIKLAKVVSRTGINGNTVNLANFYPILCVYEDGGFYECLYYSNGDPYYSDCANYKVSITLDKEFVVAASGKFVGESVDKNTVTKNYTIDCARSFAFVLSKDFESVTDTSTGVEIIYYFYDDKSPDKALNAAVKSMTLFSGKFGEYPYPTYSVVQTEFVQGGMEFPALVMISDSLDEAAYAEVVVHETAHQWWQTAVGNNEIEYGFLDEGLAEYSVVVFYENYPEYGMNRQSLIESSEKTYKLYCTVYDKLFGEVDTKMLKNLGEFKGEYEYVNLAYIKPCIMYDYLRKTVGDEGFFKGLQKYYKDYKFKNATPDDLVGIYEKLGKDTNGFFESFFNGKVII